MNIIALLAVVSSLSSTPWKELIFERAVVDCERNRRPNEEQRSRMERFYRMEIDFGVPDAARGLLLSALCNESAYVFEPGRGDEGRAVGILQFWPSHKDDIRRVQKELYNGEVPPGDSRLDHFASVTYWLRHLKKQVPRVRKHCRGKRGYESREAMVWASANLTAVARPKCVERNDQGVCKKRVPHCARAGRFETGHFERLRRWHTDAVRRYTVSDESGRQG
jgi:hypothetical protein